MSRDFYSQNNTDSCYTYSGGHSSQSQLGTTDPNMSFHQTYNDGGYMYNRTGFDNRSLQSPVSPMAANMQQYSYSDPNFMYSSRNMMTMNPGLSNFQPQYQYVTQTPMMNQYSPIAGNTQPVYSCNPIQVPNPFQIQPRQPMCNPYQYPSNNTGMQMSGNLQGSVAYMPHGNFREMYSPQMQNTPNSMSAFVHNNNPLQTTTAGQQFSNHLGYSSTMSHTTCPEKNGVYINEEERKQVGTNEGEMKNQLKSSSPESNIVDRPVDKEDKLVREKTEVKEHEHKEGFPEDLLQPPPKKNDEIEDLMVDVTQVDHPDETAKSPDLEVVEDEPVPVDKCSKNENSVQMNSTHDKTRRQEETVIRSEDQPVDLSVRPKNCGQKRKMVSILGEILSKGKQMKTNEATDTTTIESRKKGKDETVATAVPTNNVNGNVVRGAESKNLNEDKGKEQKQKIVQKEGPEVKYASLIRQFSQEVQKEMDPRKKPKEYTKIPMNIPVTPAEMQNGVIQIPVHLQFSKDKMQISCQIETNQGEKGKQNTAKNRNSQTKEKPSQSVTTNTRSRRGRPSSCGDNIVSQKIQLDIKTNSLQTQVTSSSQEMKSNKTVDNNKEEIVLDVNQPTRVCHADNKSQEMKSQATKPQSHSENSAQKDVEEKTSTVVEENTAVEEEILLENDAVATETIQISEMSKGQESTPDASQMLPTSSNRFGMEIEEDDYSHNSQRLYQQQQHTDNTSGFNYQRSVQDNIFDRMRSGPFTVHHFPNMPPVQRHYSHAIPNPPFNQSHLGNEQFYNNNGGGIFQQSPTQNRCLDKNYQMHRLQSPPLPSIHNFQRQPQLPMLPNLRQNGQMNLQQNNDNNSANRLPVPNQNRGLLSQNYLDALSQIQDRDDDMYSAFANVAVLDSEGQEVTTEDLFNMDLKKNEEESLRLDVNVVDIQEIRELRKKYFLGETKSTSENDDLRSHTNGRLESTCNDDHIFKKPDPPLKFHTSRVNNCQAVVSPLNPVQREQRAEPTSTITASSSTTSTTSNSFPDVEQNVPEVDGIIEFDTEGDYTDTSYDAYGSMRDKKLDQLRRQMIKRQLAGQNIYRTTMDVDDILLTSLHYIDQSGDLKKLCEQGLRKQLTGIELSEEAKLLLKRKDKLVVDFLKRTVHKYCCNKSMNLTQYFILRGIIVNQAAAVIPEIFLVFDIVEQCIRKPNSEELPSPLSSALVFLDEEENEQSSDSMSFDEQEELMSKGKKRVRKAVCAERRAVLKDMMNLKEESCETKTKSGKVDKPWTYKDESAWLEVFHHESAADKNEDDKRRWLNFAREMKAVHRINKTSAQCKQMYRRMKRRSEEMTKTGSTGPSTPLEEKLFKAMVDEADILGDTTGSSANGIEVRDPIKSGKFVENQVKAEQSKQTKLLDKTKKTAKKLRKSNEADESDNVQVQPYAPPLSTEKPKGNFGMLMNTFNDFKSTTGSKLDRLNSTLERIADKSDSK